MLCHTYLDIRMKYIFSVLLAFVALFSSTQGLSASQFNQKYTITYVFSERGNATVTKQILLTNLDENVYPSQYYLDIPEDAINISAFDEDGKIELEIAYLGDKKQALLHLNSQNIGISNTTVIALVYETRQLAKKQDDWSVFIPPTSPNESVSHATIQVELPENWGVPQIISPQPSGSYVWEENEALQGIRISYETEPLVTPATSITESEELVARKSFRPFLGLALGIGIVALGYVIVRILQKI